MIGWFGLDYKPVTMLWSVPQFLFSTKNDVRAIFGHAFYYFDMIEWFVLDYKPLTMLWSFLLFFFPDKIALLDNLDMRLIIFHAFSQYWRLG